MDEEGKTIEAASPEPPVAADLTAQKAASEDAGPGKTASPKERSAAAAAAPPPAAAPPAETPAPDPGSQAAAELAAAYKDLLPAAVRGLISGTTVAEVKASYTAAQKVFADARAAVLAEQGAAVPPAHAGAGGQPVPNTAFEMIQAGVSQAAKH